MRSGGLKRHLAASAPRVCAASSYDHVGRSQTPSMTRLMLQVMSLYDSLDPCGTAAAEFRLAFDEYPAKIRIGIPRAFFFDDLDPRLLPQSKGDRHFRKLNARFATSNSKCHDARWRALKLMLSQVFVEHSRAVQPRRWRAYNPSNLDAQEALRAAASSRQRHDIQEIFSDVICC